MGTLSPADKADTKAAFLFLLQKRHTRDRKSQEIYVWVHDERDCHGNWAIGVPGGKLDVTLPNGTKIARQHMKKPNGTLWVGDGTAPSRAESPLNCVSREAYEEGVRFPGTNNRWTVANHIKNKSAPNLNNTYIDRRDRNNMHAAFFFAVAPPDNLSFVTFHANNETRNGRWLRMNYILAGQGDGGTPQARFRSAVQGVLRNAFTRNFVASHPDLQ